MDKQQLEAIRARDADDYAAADILRNIRSAGNTDPELEATINMIADRRDLLAAYDALAAENAALRARLAEAETLLREVQPFIGREPLSVREQIDWLTPIGNRIDAFLAEGRSRRGD